MIALHVGGSLASMIRKGIASVRAWQVWTLRTQSSVYIVSVVAVAVVIATAAAARTTWTVEHAATYLGLLGCGLVAIEATRTVREVKGTVGRDLQTVWYLAIAITLPPAYALLAPIPLTAFRLWRVRRVLIYRRVFSNATISLAYGGASAAFHQIPASLAGPAPGSGVHAITWTGLAACCGALAWIINNGLLLGAIKLADPGARVSELFGNREAISSDLIELTLAVSLALVVAINPVLMALALPSIVLYRRHLMQAQLVAQARIDPKTGLLNAETWRREAEVEFIRAVPSRSPLALVVVHVDHFDSVSETAGHRAGDQVLRYIARMLTDILGGGGLSGRTDREEFAILLPQTSVAEARRIGERMRDHIAGEPIAIEDGSHAGFVFRLTVSIGIAVLDHSRRALGELIGAADGALSEAKATGRNKVFVMPRTVEPG
jgi:diguanylate cyclase (GGDEF)-like protein